MTFLKGDLIPMHMRRKNWAMPELTACSYYIPQPETVRGHWHEQFEKKQPLHVELGCGKGVSTAQMVHDHPEINYLAIDVSSNVLGSTRRNIAAVYGEEPVRNVMLTTLDIGFINQYMAPEDEVERIYIHFCNPWSERKKHAKRRLTHPRQLSQYRAFLKVGGEIWFKTDDVPLFEDSIEYFKETGFSIRYITRDLHADGFTPNYISEHEKKFTELGMPIHMLIAVKEDVEIAPQRIR